MEVRVGDPLPNSIILKDAKGKKMEQKVEYEWIPVSCKPCGVFWHTGARCLKKEKAQR